MSSEVIMDHFLENNGEFGKHLALQLWRELVPDIAGVGGHSTSSASATDSSSWRAAKVSLVGRLGWADTRLVAVSEMRKVISVW
jgi:hypothetical protein